LCEIDRAFATYVAAADLSHQIVECEVIAVSMNVNGKLIGRRQRQCKVGQVVEIGKILALQFDVGVDATEVERLGDGATHLDARGPGIDRGLELVRMIELDIEQCAARELELEGLFIECSFPLQAEGLGLMTGAVLLCTHFALERQFTDGIVDLERAALEREMMQRRQLGGLFRSFGLRLGGAKVPVGAPTFVLNKFDFWIVELEGCQHQMANEQVLEYHGDVQPRQFDHVVLAGPVRIADGEALDLRAGSPGKQVYAQIAVDRDRPLDVARYHAAQGPAQRIPVQQRQDEHHQQQQSNAAANP